MLETIELKTSPELKKLIQSAFPSYKKQKAFLSAFPENGMNINSFWDGGSRDEYVVIDLATGKRKPLPTSTHPYFDIAARGLAGQETPDIESDTRGNLRLRGLPEGFALVQGGTFCGKTATAHVYLNQANLTKMLTA